ncbi:MAG: hypothetical protein EP319_05625 [Deltaproteobacteria bacterium]|nr:MAG: hypothetical protein EP319_05625 [Deltaproteobacteria bacterium]
MKKLTVLLFISIFSSSAWAYPHFVGFGYTSCATCHYNPFGNGPLNDYGRALSATAVSAKWFYYDKESEENIANNSGFFGTKPQQTWFRPSFDYRGMVMKRSLGQDSEDTEMINMQADANLVLKFGEGNKFFVSGTIGYAPEPQSLANSTEEVDKYRSREHYMGYRPIPSLGIYAGLMDKVFGIRIAEHSAYSRSINNLSQNDQSHGLQLHYANPTVEIGAGYFVGNMVQDADIRQKGFSTKIDYIVSHKSSLGVSYLNSQSEFLKNYAAAIHYMGTVGKGSSVLLEMGQNVKTAVLDSTDETKTVYGLGQNYIRASRGFYLLNSIEYMKEQTGEYRLRFGPGIQIFPLQRWEARFEIYNTRNFSDESSTKDTWDLLMQIHTWF